MMKPLPLYLVISLLLAAVAFDQVSGQPPVVPTAEASGVERERAFLGRTRQLTFEGRRAGEGYFSADGRQLVFQSEREPDNPFFQIYLLDLTSGETRRISPGNGKTTCAFLRPGSTEILFASTHHDERSLELQRAEFERRAQGTARRYEWDFDPEMELYVAGLEGAPRRLTSALGYDAEGSYSPDGKWIVFASNRAAYAEALDAAAVQARDLDPSASVDLYRMRADGSALQRLTESAGYDGGPFFTADGASIVWRRFRPDGLVADIWIMNADGSAPRRLTDFGCMSWAPYPHPSGEYVFFTANKLGHANFEIYLVDIAGTKEPVRVSFTDGFDGLPVPSPDGKRLAWTSNRRGGGGQIFIADWDHERARKALREAPSRPQESR